MRKTWTHLLLASLVIVSIIFGIRHFKNHAPVQTEIPKNSQETISNHLVAIKENRLTDSYEIYTSAPFQRATPLDRYLRFILSRPNIFYYQAVKLSDPITSGEREVVIATLPQIDGTTQKLEYSLVKENDDWKIISLQLLPQDETQPEEQNFQEVEVQEEVDPLNLKGISVGASVNSRGEIEEAGHTFSPNAKLYFLVEVENGRKGAELQLELIHDKTQFSTPKISTILPKNGDANITFAFTPPENGWPFGKYQARVTSNSQGLEESFWIFQN